MRTILAFRLWKRDERGATAIEYALIAGIMMTALLAVIGTGGALALIYDDMTQISDAMQ